MKKLSLLFAMLTMVVSGAWASADLTKVSDGLLWGYTFNEYTRTDDMLSNDLGTATTSYLKVTQSNNTIADGVLTCTTSYLPWTTTDLGLTTDWTFSIDAVSVGVSNWRDVLTLMYSSAGGYQFQKNDLSPASINVYSGANGSTTYQGTLGTIVTDATVTNKTITVTYSSTNQVLKAYVNGALVMTLNNVESFPLYQVQLGSYPGGERVCNTGAKYDNLGIWNRALTDAEVAKLNGNLEAGKYYRMKSAQSGGWAKASDSALGMNGSGAETYFFYDGTNVTFYEYGRMLNGTSLSVGEGSTVKFMYSAKPTTEAKYNVMIGDNYFQYYGGYKLSSTLSTDYSGLWVIEEVTSLPITVQSSRNYATACFATNVIAPEDDLLGVATKSANGVIQIDYLQKDQVAPANTGLIVRRFGLTADKTYNFATTTGEAVEHLDILKGTVAATTLSAGDYIFTSGSQGIGFYPMATDATNYVLSGHKAYIEKPSEARACYVFGQVGETTAINTLDAAVNASVKNGKFINNGRVVIVKNGKKFNTAGQAVK